MRRNAGTVLDVKPHKIVTYHYNPIQRFVMHDLILFAKALADPTRLRVLALLRSQGLCVCELVDAMEISQSTLSTHLQVIRQAQLVTVRKEGKWVYYTLEPTQTALIESLFNHHKAAFEADKRLQRDAARVEQRLTLREGGRCVLGFDQLDRTQAQGDKPKESS